MVGEGTSKIGTRYGWMRGGHIGTKDMYGGGRRKNKRLGIRGEWKLQEIK